MMKLKLESIDYHRNGVSGLGFHVMIAKDGKDRMLIVRFNKDADKTTGGVVCAAFSMRMLANGNIAFEYNSFRGDCYAPEADRLIEATPYEEFARNKRHKAEEKARKKAKVQS